ncbi:hypothetical protein ACVR1I_08065 [Streptococcus cameli]
MSYFYYSYQSFSQAQWLPLRYKKFESIAKAISSMGAKPLYYIKPVSFTMAWILTTASQPPFIKTAISLAK